MTKLEGPCIIKIYTKTSNTWKKVTKTVFERVKEYGILPEYIREGETICLNCYNVLLINRSFIFIQHALEHEEEERETEEKSNNKEKELSFSRCVEIITKILYEREFVEKQPSLYTFKEFRMVMEFEDKRLKGFFDKLYLSTNSSSRKGETWIKTSKQLVFLCYFLCGIRNKYVSNMKRNLGMYLDFTSVPDAIIDTLAAMELTQVSRTITRQKDKVSDAHHQTVNNVLSDSAEMAIVLNIDDYHSIHSKRMPNTTTTSTAVHLATILLNLIKFQPAISNINIHNPALVDAILIKNNIEVLFMTPFSCSHNQR